MTSFRIILCNIGVLTLFTIPLILRLIGFPWVFCILIGIPLGFVISVFGAEYWCGKKCISFTKNERKQLIWYFIISIVALIINTILYFVGLSVM